MAPPTPSASICDKIIKSILEWFRIAKMLFNFLTHLCGYFRAYAVDTYPPRSWPRRIIYSNPSAFLQSSRACTNCSSASLASLPKFGRLLRPKPNMSSANTGRPSNARAGRFFTHRPTPPPKPCSSTSGTWWHRTPEAERSGELSLSLKPRVHM